MIDCLMMKILAREDNSLVHFATDSSKIDSHAYTHVIDAHLTTATTAAARD